MGTWNASILGNDTSCEIRDNFLTYYNEGADPKDLEKLILKENSDIFKYERTNAWLGLAFASWECKALSKSTLNEIKRIIDTKEDIELNIKLDADDTFLKKRQKYLEQFLIKISTDKKNAIRRKKETQVDTSYKAGMCFSYKNINNKYIGVYLTSSEHKKNEGRIDFFIMDFESNELPSLEMFSNSKLYGLTKLGAEWGKYEYQGNVTNINYREKTKQSFFEILPKTFFHIGDLSAPNDSKLFNDSRGDFMNFTDTILI